jgi:inosose dehydratase
LPIDRPGGFAVNSRMKPDLSSAPLHRTSSRRQFLHDAAAAAAALGWAGLSAGPTSRAAEPAAATAPVGSNIYGWSQYYQRMKKNVNDHLDDVMTALHECGYDYLEAFLDTGTPENTLRLADRMRAKGLRPVCLYTGARLHEPEQAPVVVKRLLAAAQACQKAGFTVIDCNPDPIGRSKTDDELKTQAASLNDLGRGLKDLGLKLGIHNHTPEMADGAREFHYNLRQTDPAVVGLNYDVHWVFRGGLNPPEVLKEYGSRIVSWHLRQSRDGVWWEILDRGDIDYAPLAKFAQERQLTAPLTVELAIENGTTITRDVVENHRLSREWVRKVFGA